MTEIIKKLDIKTDREILKRAYIYEEDVFKKAAVGQYNIVPFTKYGSCYAIYNNEDIISLIEVIFSLDNVAYLYGVSTNAKYRHKGYASKLLNFVIEDIKQFNIKHLELTTSIENDIAINLYKKFNFYIKETLIDEYFDNEDRYLMRKDL